MSTNVILCDIYKNTIILLKENIREINIGSSLGVFPKDDELDELDSLLDIMIKNQPGHQKYSFAENFINKYK